MTDEKYTKGRLYNETMEKNAADIAVNEVEDGVEDGVDDIVDDLDPDDTEKNDTEKNDTGKNDTDNTR